MVEDPGKEEIIDGHHLLPTLPVITRVVPVISIKDQQDYGLGRWPPMSPAPY